LLLLLSISHATRVAFIHSRLKDLLMANQNSVDPMGPVGGGGSSRASSQINATSTSNSASNTASNDSFADSLSKALTSGGKATFESPGAQKDFESGMRSAINNMIEGGKSGDKEQMMKGITELLSLIGGLASAQGKKGGKDEGALEKGGGAQGAQGSSPDSGASGAESDDKKKKLMELIQMLMAMGVSPEMISQLLQSMGIPAAEAQQMMSQAQQQQGQDPAAGDSTKKANMPNQAMMA
jgi:hypothetical protein